MSFPMNRTTIGKPLPPLTLRGELWKWIKSFFLTSGYRKDE
jgi:hypothetical protein